MSPAEVYSLPDLCAAAGEALANGNAEAVLDFIYLNRSWLQPEEQRDQIEAMLDSILAAIRAA